MIVVFGSVNVDFVTRVPAIPRPGETVLGPDYRVIPGGKGANQALAARRCGAEVHLVGAVGSDPFAAIGLSLLEADGVETGRVERLEAPTGAAFISVDRHGENAIVVASGANAEARAAAMAGLPLGPGTLLMLQREVPDAEALAAARAVKAAGGRVILNAAPAGAVAPDLVGCLDVLIVNEHEVAVVGAGLGHAGSPDEIARAIDAEQGVPTVVTLGGEGAIGWVGGIRRGVPAWPVTVVDTTAAGDAFCGAFAAALDRGLHFTAALARGAAAGSLACTVAGAQTSLPRGDAVEAAVAGWTA